MTRQLITILVLFVGGALLCVSALAGKPTLAKHRGPLTPAQLGKLLSYHRSHTVPEIVGFVQRYRDARKRGERHVDSRFEVHQLGRGFVVVSSTSTKLCAGSIGLRLEFTECGDVQIRMQRQESNKTQPTELAVTFGVLENYQPVSIQESSRSASNRSTPDGRLIYRVYNPNDLSWAVTHVVETIVAGRDKAGRHMRGNLMYAPEEAWVHNGRAWRMIGE
ncbi:MAG: hypothetical protein H6707_04075 [Deltaproteobacteria bacterium]|nr:hypothetical protein [Deltaproteobacteria bacterium]